VVVTGSHGLDVAWKTSQNKTQEHHEEMFLAADLRVNCLIFRNSGAKFDVLVGHRQPTQIIPGRIQGLFQIKRPAIQTLV